ncbi:Unknown protein, partial [Striga hermonthica]
FETIFKNGDLILMKENIKSLRQDHYVEVCVLDTWCRILNLRELNKKPDMPFRFFGSSYSSMHSVPMPNENWDYEKKARLFCDGMADDLRKAGCEDKLEDIDMIMFPVCKSEHLYVVSFDFKEDAIDILDNSSVGGTKLSKYQSQHVHL